MIIKKGYKKTDIGEIPVEWDVVELGNLAKVTMGQSPNSINYNVQRIGLPLIQGNADIKNRKTIIRNYTSEITKICNVDDIIMSVRAPVGEIARATFNACIGRGVCAITYKNDFLYHYLIFIEKEWGKLSTGSTFDSVNSSIVKTIKIPLPPLPEQKVIAKVLSDMDNLITALEAEIEKMRLVKQGAMQELLSAGDDWEVRSLGEVGKTYGGLSGKSKKDFSNGNSKYIPFMNVMSNPIIDTEYLDTVSIKNNESQNKALKGDLFFNGSSETPEEVGLSSVLLEDIDNLYLNSFCFGFRLFDQKKVDGLYLSYFFRSNKGRELFYSLAQGATRYNLSKTNFLKLEFHLPTYEEQTRIAKILTDIDLTIGSKEAELEKYRAMKVGLMQELLSGKRRLVRG